MNSFLYYHIHASLKRNLVIHTSFKQQTFLCVVLLLLIWVLVHLETRSSAVVFPTLVSSALSWIGRVNCNFNYNTLDPGNI